MTLKTVTEIRLVGGHPVLDFANTVDARRDRWGPDALVSYGDLVTWAGRIGLIDAALADQLRRDAAADDPAASASLDRAKEARELLYAVFLDEARGNSTQAGTATALGSLVDGALAHRTLVQGHHGFAWGWASSGLDTIMHRLVLTGADLLACRHERRLVRECLGANCGWLFLDHSRGGQRRWCSDEACGTRARVERFRRRTDTDASP